MGLEGWQSFLRRHPDALDLKRNRTSVLVGIFHTHPNTATPSDADLATTDAFQVPGFIVRAAGAKAYGPARRPTITGPRGAQRAARQATPRRSQGVPSLDRGSRRSLCIRDSSGTTRPGTCYLVPTIPASKRRIRGWRPVRWCR